MDRRRVTGAVFLSIAVLMLVGGKMVLPEGTSEVWKLVYWLVCFLFTVLAMMIALVDLRAVRRITQEEQRDLVQGMVKEVIEENQSRGKGHGEKGSPGGKK